MLRSDFSVRARPITVACKERSRSRSAIRAIKRSAGASAAMVRASGIAEVRSSGRRTIIGMSGAALAMRCASAVAAVRSAASGSDATTADGLISASAVGAADQDVSITGNAPALVNACTRPPAGWAPTTRIGPCKDINGRPRQRESRGSLSKRH